MWRAGSARASASTRALNDVNFSVESGRIVGLIGPNGAGKTTALKALLGLTRFEGELSVLGLDPYRQRHRLMQDVCFIADVAVLPRWIRVRQLIDFVAATHPRFRRDVCEQFLSRSDVSTASRVKELSKGMVTQLHLALVMAIDAKLLVLDEPTLGLDILMRKQFYETLLERVFRRTAHHPRHDTPGRGGRAHPDRPLVHRSRAHCARRGDGPSAGAVRAGVGPARAPRRGPHPPADLRAPGARPHRTCCSAARIARISSGSAKSACRRSPTCLSP